MATLDSTTVYEIARWRETFETADSRKHKSLQWVSMPIDRQSNGYQSMIDHFGDESPAIYGAWCALVSIAAGCHRRGVLATSKGEPISIHRIARMAHMPCDPFEKLFDWAVRDDVNWLVTSCQSIDDRSSTRLPNITLPNTTEQSTARAESASLFEETPESDQQLTDHDSDVRSFCEWWNTLQACGLVSCGINNVDEPSRAVKAGWNRVKKDRDLRVLIEQRDEIEHELRASSFAKKATWLRPEKLLGGKNRDGEWIVKKLLEGGFRDETQHVGSGQVFDPSTVGMEDGF